MGKSASREDRGKRSSFSMSYEGAQRDPSNHISMGGRGFNLSFKGSTIAVATLAVVAVGGIAAHSVS